MAQLVENDPLVMEAVAELRRFSSDPQMRELERRRKLWKLEYYSGLEAAKEEGKKEKAIEVARNMKRKGFDAKTVAEITGLSLKKIEQLVSNGR